MYISAIVIFGGRRGETMDYWEDKLFSQNLFNTLQADKKRLFEELLAELLINVKKGSLFDEKNF